MANKIGDEPDLKKMTGNSSKEYFETEEDIFAEYGLSTNDMNQFSSDGSKAMKGKHSFFSNLKKSLKGYMQAVANIYIPDMADTVRSVKDMKDELGMRLNTFRESPAMKSLSKKFTRIVKDGPINVIKKGISSKTKEITKEIKSGNLFFTQEMDLSDMFGDTSEDAYAMDASAGSGKDKFESAYDQAKNSLSAKLTAAQMAATQQASQAQIIENKRNTNMLGSIMIEQHLKNKQDEFKTGIKTTVYRNRMIDINIAMNRNIARLVSFNEKIIKYSVLAGLEYQQKSLKLSSETFKMLKALKDETVNIHKIKEANDHYSSRAKAHDIFATSSVDVGGWANRIKENIKMAFTSTGIGQAASSLGMMKEMGDMTGGFNIPQMLLTGLPYLGMSGKTRFGLEKTNAMFKGLMGTMNTRLLEMRNSSSNWKQLLGQSFGIKDYKTQRGKFAAKAGEKAPFDQRVYTAITVAIPSLLGKIYGAVSGGEEISYNYKQGTFQSTSDIKSRMNVERTRSLNQSQFAIFGKNVLLDKTQKTIEKQTGKKMTQEDDKIIRKDFETIYKNIIDQDVLIHPEKALEGSPYFDRSYYDAIAVEVQQPRSIELFFSSYQDMSSKDRQIFISGMQESKTSLRNLEKMWAQDKEFANTLVRDILTAEAKKQIGPEYDALRKKSFTPGGEDGKYTQMDMVRIGKAMSLKERELYNAAGIDTVGEVSRTGFSYEGKAIAKSPAQILLDIHNTLIEGIMVFPKNIDKKSSQMLNKRFSDRKKKEQEDFARLEQSKQFEEETSRDIVNMGISTMKSMLQLRMSAPTLANAFALFSSGDAVAGETLNALDRFLAKAMGVGNDGKESIIEEELENLVSREPSKKAAAAAKKTKKAMHKALKKMSDNKVTDGAKSLQKKGAKIVGKIFGEEEKSINTDSKKQYQESLDSMFPEGNTDIYTKRKELLEQMDDSQIVDSDEKATIKSSNLKNKKSNVKNIVKMSTAIFDSMDITLKNIYELLKAGFSGGKFVATQNNFVKQPNEKTTDSKEKNKKLDFSSTKHKLNSMFSKGKEYIKGSGVGGMFSGITSKVKEYYGKGKDTVTNDKNMEKLNKLRSKFENIRYNFDDLNIKSKLKVTKELYNKTVSKGKDLYGNALEKGKNIYGETIKKGEDIYGHSIGAMAPIFESGKDVIEKVYGKGKNIFGMSLKKGKNIYGKSLKKGSDIFDFGKAKFAGAYDSGKDILDGLSEKGKDVYKKASKKGKGFFDFGKAKFAGAYDSGKDILEKVPGKTKEAAKKTGRWFNKGVKRASNAAQNTGKDFLSGIYNEYGENNNALNKNQRNIIKDAAIKSGLSLKNPLIKKLFSKMKKGTLTENDLRDITDERALNFINRLQEVIDRSEENKEALKGKKDGSSENPEEMAKEMEEEISGKSKGKPKKKRAGWLSLALPLIAAGGAAVAAQVLGGKRIDDRLKKRNADKSSRFGAFLTNQSGQQYDETTGEYIGDSVLETTNRGMDAQDLVRGANAVGMGTRAAVKGIKGVVKSPAKIGRLAKLLKAPKALLKGGLGAGKSAFNVGRGIGKVGVGATKIGLKAGAIAGKIGVKAGAFATKAGIGIVKVVKNPGKALGVLKKGLQIAGKFIAKKMNPKTAGKAIGGITKFIIGNITKILKKGGARVTKALFKFGAKFAGPVGAAIMLADMGISFAGGMADARNILKLPKNVKIPAKYRIITGLINLLSNTFTLGLIPSSTIVDFVVNKLNLDIGLGKGFTEGRKSALEFNKQKAKLLGIESNRLLSWESQTAASSIWRKMFNNDTKENNKNGALLGFGNANDNSTGERFANWKEKIYDPFNEMFKDMKEDYEDEFKRTVGEKVNLDALDPGGGNNGILQQKVFRQNLLKEFSKYLMDNNLSKVVASVKAPPKDEIEPTDSVDTATGVDEKEEDDEMLMTQEDMEKGTVPNITEPSMPQGLNIASNSITSMKASSLKAAPSISGKAISTPTPTNKSNINKNIKQIDLSPEEQEKIRKKLNDKRKALNMRRAGIKNPETLIKSGIPDQRLNEANNIANSIKEDNKKLIAQNENASATSNALLAEQIEATKQQTAILSRMLGKSDDKTDPIEGLISNAS